MKKNVGGIAGAVAAVFYLLAALQLIVGTAMSDPNDNDDGAAYYVAWIVSVMIATIAATVVAWKAGKFTASALSKVALVIAVLAVIASFFGWLWPVWGGLLSIAFLLLVLALRQNSLGVTGVPSVWDWVIPIATPLAFVVTMALDALDFFEDHDDDLDWDYTIGFSVMAILFAATLARAGRWLGSNAQPVAPEVPASSEDTPEAFK